MSNELTDVRCPCGAEFQADSYDAGFIAGSGMCQNCDAALPPKDICTCPSGDGSLRYPCPEHPAVEQVGANVGHGHVFPRADGVKMRCGGPGLCSECAADAYRARAALAQPSPALELERPEVVARVVHSNPVVLGQCGPLNANDELMTVAQHAASVARWAEMFNRVEQERDAALARVAELELKLDQSDYSYDNDRHHMRGMAKQAAEAIQVFTGHDSGANLAHRYGEKWWEHLDELRDALLAFAKNAPVAQAQHSVPAYVSYTTQPAESLAGIALRQLKDESRWVEIRDINAHAFPDMQSHSYYPAGTVIKLPAAAPGKEVPQAWLDVQAERKRQVEVEGYHGFRDSHYINYELSKAARAYIEVSWHALSGGLPCKKPESWPWMAGFKWADGRTMLVKAGALILAEIERLDRAATGKEGV